jgi:L-arabinokinase
LSSILYYITGHGYGHAVRSHQVIDRLKKTWPDLEIYVRSTAPEWLFRSNVVYSPQAIDVGMVQKDSLAMDLEATLQACQALHRNLKVLIARETDFIKKHRICLIVGDIPPIGFEIGARAAIVSVGIGNFTWSGIYRGYINSHPAFIPLIEEMESFYRHATLALTLPYPCAMDVFPTREPIPWITRRSGLSKAEARKALQLPQSAIVVLLSFGGLGLHRFPWDRLKRDEFFFVTTGETTQTIKNVRFLPEAQRNYEDLVRAVDVVVTKPGYGIVADAIAHQVRVLYTDRGEFAEYSHLVRALDECATAAFVPQDELLSGNLGPYLTRLLTKKASWPATPLDGAGVAAAKILELING